MNKAELVNVIAEKAGMTKVDAKKALEAFMDASAEALQKGERISLVGLVHSQQQNIQQEKAATHKLVKKS